MKYKGRNYVFYIELHQISQVLAWIYIIPLTGSYKFYKDFFKKFQSKEKKCQIRLYFPINYYIY